MSEENWSLIRQGYDDEIFILQPCKSIVTVGRSKKCGADLICKGKQFVVATCKHITLRIIGRKKTCWIWKKGLLCYKICFFKNAFGGICKLRSAPKKKYRI